MNGADLVGFKMGHFLELQASFYDPPDHKPLVRNIVKLGQKIDQQCTFRATPSPSLPRWWNAETLPPGIFMARPPWVCLAFGYLAWTLSGRKEVGIIKMKLVLVKHDNCEAECRGRTE